MLAAIVFLPLLASLIVGLSCRTINRTAAQWVTAGFSSLAALLSCVIFYHVVIGQAPIIQPLSTWISSGTFTAEWALRADSLTAVMLVVVTIVSALVHIYSVGYMHHDPHVPRFMAYLSLFTFFMLLLVTSDNFLQVFIGWEGVGLCSYLLIGFWFKKPSANAAAIKAFLVNRVGDFALILGVFAIYVLFGTLQFDAVFFAAPEKADAIMHVFGTDLHAITLICILLFIGCMGKSAQFGLHTWLPDAMEGPTPVSALIHAATMVTAGVFLVARCSPLFELSPLALDVVTIVGAVTAIFAATIAITQNDIKRVIAYSTCSQLGYMFFACGVSAYAAGVFHLMTHGFFKALLFLGAGSVIHAMSDEQDMRKMGGIWKHIPVTYAMMLVGTLAIVGLPPLSGFFSKDLILESAYAAGHEGHRFGMIAFWLGIVAASLTAFYSWRLIFLTFHGKTRANSEVMGHIHESPVVMLFPLFVLATGAIFAGGFAAKILGIGDGSLVFWNDAIVMSGDFNVLEAAHHVPGWVKLTPIAVGLSGLAVAVLCYLIFPKLPGKLSRIFSPLYSFLYNKWYIDELYHYVFVKPLLTVGTFFWKIIDIKIIDRFGPNGMAFLVKKGSVLLSKVQSGYVYHYAFAILIGLVALLSWRLMEIGG